MTSSGCMTFTLLSFVCCIAFFLAKVKAVPEQSGDGAEAVQGPPSPVTAAQRALSAKMNGLIFGKRRSSNSQDGVNDDDVMGGVSGFQGNRMNGLIFGKRQAEFDASSSFAPSGNKMNGLIFGKRGAFADSPDYVTNDVSGFKPNNNKMNGLIFGKRSGIVLTDYEIDDVSNFQPNGNKMNGLIFGKRRSQLPGNQEPEESSADDFSNSQVGQGQNEQLRHRQAAEQTCALAARVCGWNR